MPRSKRDDVATKVRIKGGHQDKVREILHDHGLVALREIVRDDGDVSFELGAMDGQSLMDFLNAVPDESFALKAVVR